MISQLFIYMVKYAFGFPVVAMVSHIPVKSRMAINYVIQSQEIRVKTGILLHAMPNFLNVRLHSPVQQLSFYVTGVGSAWLCGYLL